MTLSALGCHPLTAITALTVQDTVGIVRVLPVDAKTLSEQALTVLDDMPVAAFKIGLLGSIENIGAIAEVLTAHPDIPVVLDPVLASGRGDEVANKSMIDAIRAHLLPLTTVVTPNSLEARRLAAKEPKETQSLPLNECARRLVEFGCQYALITGTHEDTLQVSNNLHGRNGLIRSDTWPRLSGSYHGSGCTLASAIAAKIAHGLAIEAAVRKAQEYTWQTLANGFCPGKGQFIPDRFYGIHPKQGVRT